MSPRFRLGLCLAAVLVAWAFHVHLKTTKIFAHPDWDPQDEVGQFWSEFAFHYRFAKFFATHPVRDWAQLSHDRDVQHPDTINDWAEFTVAMEVPAGVLYRWLKPNVPLHVFVVWYDCIISSLSLFGVFFLARALWRSDAAGLAGAVFYATLYPSYGRTVRNLFLREDFAIPIILFALFFTVRAIQEAEAGQNQSLRYEVGAALMWLAGLASWHLTQFVMAVVMVASVMVYLGRGKTPRVPVLVAVMTVGAVAIPVLRAKQFYLSPTMCLLYALTMAVWINGGRKKAGKVFLGSAALLIAAGMLLQKSYGEYAHVYELFYYKLRFLGVKPGQPSALSWEARSLWEGAFNTAAASEFWRSLQFCLPFSLLVIWMNRRDRRVAAQMFALSAILLFPLAWMVVRYFTFLGFASAVMAAGLMTRPSFWWKLVVIAAAAWQVAQLDYKPLPRVQAPPGEYRPIIRWMEEHTPTNAVILASISESPVFWAHTGRPIVLHSKFENWQIRQRYKEFLESIYEDEERFHSFARNYGADYFVYDNVFLYEGMDTRRYKADRLGQLADDCAAVMFHNRSEGMKHFKFEISNSRFAIYRVLP